jgi:DNA-binding GntR family transcriptional regulator
MDDPRKWLRVKNDLIRQLDAGVLEPGDEVISKYEAEDHGVHRNTVIIAIRSLAVEGRLERRGNGGNARYIVPAQVIDNPPDLPPTAERDGKWSSAASSLKDRITSGTIKPGTVLRCPRLASEYGVSKTIMLHALQALEREGVIKAYHGVGYLVIGTTSREVSNAASPPR